MRQNTNNLIPASYLVLIKNEKTLLLRRFQTGYEDGKYSLIAGHVEPGESFSSCIIREAKEEAGIIITRDDLKVAHIMHRKVREDSFQRISVFFTTKKWSEKITNMEPNKCDDLSWFDLNSLPSNTIIYVKDALNNIRKGRFFSEYGFT